MLPAPIVVVLTATVVEYAAVLDLLDARHSLNSASGAPYTVGSLNVEAGVWEVWVGCIGQGNVTAALQASQAIQDLQPALIVFLGTAGGLKEGVRLGDVVFATKVYGYESGKQTDERLLSRPDIALVDPQTTAFARRIAGSEKWHPDRTDSSDGLQSPWVHVAPIAAGEKIQAGQRAEFRTHLRESFNDAVAVEMEGLGFLTGAQQWSGIPAMVVRGVSDLLADKSPDQDEHVQPISCSNAARFLRDMLNDLWPSEPSSLSGRRNRGARAHGMFDPLTFVPADAADSRGIFSRGDLPAVELTDVMVGHGYLLLREIGRGSLNAVWEAEERAFGRTLRRVAVKLQPPDTTKRHRYFTREAATMASFDNPYVIPYRAAGTEHSGPLKGWSYIVTGLADGSLRDWINEQPMADEALGFMLLDLARALQYLHRQRLVHGDVKPANILNYGGRWVLGDFGLTQPTGAQEPEGTLGYMAPERFSGRVISANDVYSFAVTAVVAACGTWRNDRRTVDSTAGKVLTYLYNNIRARPDFNRDAFPEEFCAVLEMCFEEDPRDRPAMGDVIDCLKRLLKPDRT
ncbi:protein kinase domain-containing protein [Streptomyces turgidiscabies]|uniref:Kinase domain protein n=1 Tax=Streptomyces turgidiscabies (strain Car8) TaxID=698760 RepID=L7ESB1_STRT8|nr:MULTISPECIES: protein kinase [Streptomyces]ELP62313.1 kinase domain protein [Streptomyces turgidiscabies Car8]MDX3498743.1 protein kinase [Streptomyces turgidiscabies]GAQ74829.1 serine/threonine-protein kinase PknH [Streptomyces turgidiscabies]